MSVKEVIKKEIDKLPEDILAEVFDFIQFLESRKEKIFLQEPLRSFQKFHLKRYGITTRTLFMTGYEKGDVILVPFPFSNQSAVKKRPAIVISSNAYNKISSDVVIMAITSQIEKL